MIRERNRRGATSCHVVSLICHIIRHFLRVEVKMNSSPCIRKYEM